MVRDRIDISHEMLAEFCRWNHIRKLSLFGSVLRDDTLQDELSALLGRRVDLKTIDLPLPPRELDVVVSREEGAR